jgi:hypothetical protein
MAAIFKDYFALTAFFISFLMQEVQATTLLPSLNKVCKLIFWRFIDFFLE